ncbi:protein JOKA2 isoform X2 [Vitis vinifera]|uniref:protein JOKA2 isoform X2 n=1 Tax=Vitis vinifera TaxID=29760 RepID=UPI00053FE3AA|nr:protein JOKA2 isoform X2 [Vitis vinifera]|eukprot:XP_010663097.1 PREDICTED: protein NBR1 homolog isoform X2 [Vitis vinifera]
MESTKVIKVKYGNTLRRFNACLDENGELDLDINGLRAKVITLFNLVPDADLTLTYIDEDGDVVTLVDDEDLHDVMRQRLKFLRITVLLNIEKDGRSHTRSSGSSTPMRSPFNLRPFQDGNAGVAPMRSPFDLRPFQDGNAGVAPMRPPFDLRPFQDGNAGVAEFIKSVPEPLLEAFSKLSTDFTSKAASSAPVLSEVLTCLSKMGESYLNSVSPSEVGADSSTHNRSSDNSVDPLVTENTKAPQADSKQELLPTAELKDSNSKLNEVGTTGPVSRAGIASNVPATDNKEANVESNVAPVASNDPSVDKRKETKKESKYAPIACSDCANDPSVDKRKETKKESKYPPVACSDCASDGRKGTKKGSVDHYGEKLADCVASTWNAGYPRPYNPDPSHITCLDSGISKKISSDGRNYAAPNFGNPFSDCPFTGMPPVNNSLLSTGARPRPPLFKRSYKDAMGGTFHKGIQCDGCGVHPITGPRFKSKVKEDYDLCSICFSDMGNEADYIRIDWPARQHPWSFKMSHDPMQQPEVHSPAQPYPSIGCGIRVRQPHLDSRFILDVNVIDGTVMAPSIPFTKTWRMRNTGNAVWARGTRLVWIGGDRFSEKDSVEICRDCVPIGEELEISVDFTAPEFPGRYISYWRMAAPSGQTFGQRVWVLIQVDSSLKDLLGDSMPVINLNFPPSSGGSKSPQIIDVNVEPVVDGGLVEVNEPVKPIVKEHANKNQELNFPIDDNLLATNVVPGPVSPENNSSVSYPIIDFSDAAPISGVDKAALDQAALEEVMGKNDGVEQSLLKALDEMGFKCDAFNKEILRMHEYDLEETVNHLCGVGEWDPILEELKEMGFNDTELNKKLLRKNNGSLKRVVMDLIAVEKY